MPTPREVLELLPRADLLWLADRLGVEPPGRRSKQPIVDALVSLPGGKAEEMLLLLSREQLKELCRKLGLETGGRDKAGLVARLLSESTSEAVEAAEPVSVYGEAPTSVSIVAAFPRRVSGAQLLDQLLGSFEFLRGTGEPVHHRTSLSVLLLLKRLNDVFEERVAELLAEGAPEAVAYGDPDEHEFFIPEEARWSRLRYLSHLHIDHDLNRACSIIEHANPQLERVLTSVDFADERWFGGPSQRKSLLQTLVHSFSGLPLHELALAEPGALGHAYSAFLEQTAHRARKRGGTSFTPVMLVRLMVELLDPQEGMSICDPVCGTGSTLLGCAEYVEAHGGDARNIRLEGQEKQIDNWVLARINMLLHGLHEARIEAGDTIREPRLVTDGQLDRYDRVIANPPFSLRWWGHEVASYDPYGRFRYGMPPRDHGDFAFLQHMVATLKPSGQLATVVPHGVLFRGKVEAKIRAAMLGDDLFEAVIGLPGGLFLGTSLPAAILVLNRSKPEKRKGKVLFIDASQEFHEERPWNRLRAEDVARIVTTFNEFVDVPRYARVVGLDEISANEFSLAIHRYVEARPLAAEERTESLEQMWRRIELKNYRSIAEASVELAPFTVVVGPNGSGKSNFADAFVFARDVATDAETAVERRGGLVGLRRWQPGEDADLSVDIRSATSRAGLDTDYLRHQFTIRSGGARGWSFRGETIELFSRGEPVFRLERTPDGVEIEPERLAESVGRIPKLSETASAMVFARQMALLSRRAALRNVTRIRLNPDSMRQPQSATENTRLEESGSNIAVAFRSLDATGQERVVTAMQRIVPGLLRMFVESFDRFLLLRFEQQQAAGQVARFSTSEMSEGALRALGILVATQQMARDELLIIEEPEVAIHVGAAQLLFDVLKDASTQGSVLITTHSADLLDAAREEEILVCSYRDGVTQVGPLASVQREVVRQGLFTVAELMRSEPLRIEGDEPGIVQL
ncbi:N-6 DNA methylase [Archangium lipolyticum]|uniref:N-6 DNA methylase n=1 Tax=Archangium lipolyticum TaxID=2970465 RepID=UPI00214A2865|nr:N-6 DNA methylase [Archangium lipolyticum]